ncbi:MAG: D-alanyl-D-alanine carboxypeptidase [Pseudomonadota bacterium]|nr:D-alanyl-D-alanine carboxypeptidase [Pseudomonadota bacterium]
MIPRLLIGLLLLLPGLAGAVEAPPALQLPVRSFLLEDFYSGRVLAEQAADERMEPASITKLMTAYVVYQAIEEGRVKPADLVTISEKAWRMEGSRMFVEVGTQVSVEDLIRGMVIQSGNDATVALAEHTAGSEGAFAALMNREAVRLGLTNTHFVNSSGLPDPQHYTTARDIATLVRALIRDFPNHYSEYAVRDFTYNGITQHNRNRLLWQDQSVDGVKTGHTSSAGFCLAASAKRGDMRLISVVLGAKSEQERFSTSQELLNYGFRFFETYKLYAAAETLATTRVWKGSTDSLPLGLAEDLYVTIPRGQYEQLQASMQIAPGIEAPVQQGAPLGSVRITLNDATVANPPLVAKQDVNQGGLVRRLYDQGLLMFNSLIE